MIPELQELYTDIRRVDVNYYIPQPDPFVHFKNNIKEKKSDLKSALN